jgi:polysaccharide deacetylase 2 family uncharacterized protein YibQ
MPKRKRSTTTPSPRILIVFAVAAVLCFLAGETWFLLSTDAGRLTIARFGFGDRARVTQIIGRHAHEALRLAGVPADSVRESIGERGAAPVRWRVGLKPEDSTLQTHYALAEELARCGARVLSGRESLGAHGESVVTLLVGVGGRATHEITIVRAVRVLENGVMPAGKLALVLYGFGDDLEAARAFMAIGAPFAVAVVPGGKSSADEFKAAHAAQREVVMHLPLEPINYPQVDPGPATILVTMSPAQIAGRVRKGLDQAGPVVAVANHMGSLATQDMTVMTAVFRELKRARLPFQHVSPAPGAVCKALAADLGVPCEEPDAVLDAETRDASGKALDRRWKELLKSSRSRHTLVVWIRATPLTRQWLPRALAPKALDGASVVPLSSLLQRPLGD